MTVFEVRFSDEEGMPRSLDPEAAEAVRAALESLARAVARKVGMTTYPTVVAREGQ